MQSGLMMFVIGFKLLEWWYGTAEETLTTSQALPVPPPPPRPQPHPDGASLPADQQACPLCNRKIRNPAMATCSGYVFCCPCLEAYVERHRRCPVTLYPCRPEGIRRLFVTD